MTGKSGTKDIEPVSVLQAVTKIKKSGSTSGEGFNTVVLGVREDSTLVPQLVSGRNAADEKEAVASESLSTKDGVQLGESVSVGRAGYTYKIVGFTKTAEYNTEPVIYVRNGTFTLPSAYASMSSDASVTEPPPIHRAPQPPPAPTPSSNRRGMQQAQASMTRSWPVVWSFATPRPRSRCQMAWFHSTCSPSSTTFPDIRRRCSPSP
jgi:hypothetical protein